MSDQLDEFNALTARVSQGDESAWTELVRLYEPELHLAAKVFLGPALRAHLDPMDLVQSVHRLLFVGVREHKFDISTRGRLFALANTLLRRRIARHWRQCQRQKDNNGSEEDSQLLSSLTSPEQDPAQAAQYHDGIEHFLNRLDEMDRQLVELRLQGYSTAEAARALQVDPDVLRVRLSRLRRNLRETSSFTEWL